MNFVRNAAGMLFTSVVNVPIGMLTSVILARFLSLDERGLYSVVFATVAMLVLLAQLGLPSAVIYRMRRVGSAAADVAASGLLLILVVSLVVAAVALVGESFFIARFLHGATPEVYRLAVAIVPLELLVHYLGALARGIDHFRIRNWYSFLIHVAILGTAAVVLVLRSGDLLELLTWLVLTRAALVVLFAVAVYRQTGLSLRLRLGELAASMRFGLKSYLVALAGRLHERVDIFMIAYLLADPTQNAYYAVAVGVVQQLKLTPKTIAAAAYPKVAGEADRKAIRFVCAASRQSTAWVVVSAIALMAVAPVLIPLLFGEDYRASVAPFMVLLPGFAMMTVYRVLAQYFVSRNRQQVNVATQLVSVCTNVVLNLFWIPRYGVTGAAAASLVSYSLETVLITAVFVRHGGCRVRDLFVFRREDLREYERRLAPLARRLGWSGR